jgi:predicted Zn-dependent protease
MSFFRLKTILLPVLAMALLAARSSLVSSEVSGSDLPDFGDSSGSLISPAQEVELGEEFMRSVRAQATLVADPDLNRYIRRLGGRLVANSDAPNYPFTFFVVQDPSINAFAGPGGYIGIHTGLILAARNESELAGVMAHEIAHVTQRHLLRAYEAANQLSLPTAAATIAAILLGAATSSDAGIAAASAIQAGSIQYQLNFTRANEKEADRIGIQTLARSGIDPFGMPSFFERLYQSTRLYGSANIPEFLSTHPVTTDRIAESIQRAEQQGRGKNPDSLEFQLERARLDVLLANNPAAALREYEALAARKTAGPAEHYGLALAQWRSGASDKARAELLGLTKTDPDRILYRTTLARVLLESGHQQEALQLYEDTLNLYPGDEVIGQYYADALLRAGKAGQARDLVREMLRDEEARTPEMYQLWARAASKSGPPWETNQASAELYYLNGDLRLAVDQLQQGLRHDGLSRYDRDRMQARLEQFKQILAEQAKK